MTGASPAGAIVTDWPRAVNLGLDQAPASFRRYVRAANKPRTIQTHLEGGGPLRMHVLPPAMLNDEQLQRLLETCRAQNALD